MPLRWDKSVFIEIALFSLDRLRYILRAVKLISEQLSRVPSRAHIWCPPLDSLSLIKEVAPGNLEGPRLVCLSLERARP